MAGELHLHITDPRNVQKVVGLDPGTYTMGSDDQNQIHLQDSTISWRHAVLTNNKDGVFIEDLKSMTGTYLDGHRVKERQQVQLGQRIQLGGFVLMLQDPNAPAVAPAPPPKEEIALPVAPVVDEAPPVQTFTAVPVNRKTAAEEHRLEQKRVIKKQIHEELLERLDLKRLTAAQAGTADLSERARDIIEQIIADVQDRLPEGYEPEALAKEVFDEALGLGPLEDYLDDPDITEIMVNGFDRIYIEKAGKLIRTDMTFVDEDSVNSIIERIVAPIGRRIDESQPYVDARLLDGSRVNAIIPPLSLIGPVITIRKFSKDPFTVEQLVRMGSVSPEMVRFIDACVKVRKNIIISGGTGTGKTTFLNVLSSYLPEDERIVTIEDAAELRLTQDHVIKLEARPPNIEGKGAITIRDLVRNALRMRPDRIVVGECRGGEALDMLQAMNTGHEGSLTTIHANSPRDAMARLETLVLMAGMELPLRAIREQIGSAIQMVIQLTRFVDGTRKVSRVTEICGMEGDKIVMQDLFEFKQTGYDADNKVMGKLVPTGNVPTFLGEFRVRQIPIDTNIFNPGEEVTELLVQYGIWFIPLLYMMCFGMLAFALVGGLHEAADTYQSVYAEQASRELEDLFMFIDAKRIADLARVTAITVFLTVFMLGGDLSSPAGMFRGVFLGVLAAGLILLAPTHFITLLRKRRLERFNIQLTEALTGMSNALRAGFSIQQSFEAVVQEGQKPISQEFGVFLQQCRVGVNFDDAMQNLEERVGSEDLTLMVRAIEIARQTGGNLTEVFDQIASTIRERTRVEGRIRALTAMGRLQGLVVGLIPIFLLFVMTMLDPEMMMNFFTSVPGIAMLITVVVIEIIGFLVIRKIVNIDV